MHAPLFVFEFLGTTELMVIALVALILFGPRKLPEIGRTVGKSIAEFKRASDDFKRTWEFEVELEQRKSAPEAEATAVAPPPSAPAAELGEGGAQFGTFGETVARAAPGAWAQEDASGDGAWEVATGHAQNATPGVGAGSRANGGASSRAGGDRVSLADEDEINAS